MGVFDTLFHRPAGTEKKTQYDLLGWLQDPKDIMLKARVENAWGQASMMLLWLDLSEQAKGGKKMQTAMFKQALGYAGFETKDLPDDYELSPADYGRYFQIGLWTLSVSQYGLSRVETLRGAIGASGGPYDKIAQELAATGALTK